MTSFISIIIPVHNCEKYLAEAIESILAQNYPDYELIVVDDGSSDRSREIALSYRDGLQYVYQDNQGAAAARNLGARLAAGEFLAFLDADDLWVPHKLSCQMELFSQDHSLEMAFSYGKQFISPELDAASKSKLEIQAEVLPAYTPCSMLIKKDSFLKVGFFSSRWRCGEFIEWYARAVELGIKSAFSLEVLFLRRLHKIGFQKTHYQDYVHVIKEFLDRKRKKEG